MNKILDIINLDDSYYNQSFYKDLDYNILDLSELRGVNYFCSFDTLDIIRKSLEDIKIGGFKYYGSGNFHYLTYLMLEKIKEDFSLVLFDHHVEMLYTNYEDLISCGSWLIEVIERNKYIKEVYLIGVSEKYIDIIPSDYLYSGNLKIISEEEVKRSNSYLKKIKPSYNLYITIDKDVFSERVAKTNWDQGSLEFRDFKNIISSLENYRILGVDICGEDDFRSGNIFDRNRIFNLRKNNSINLEIIKCLREKINK